MRLVSREVNNALETNKNSPANFGLMFNKWLAFEERNGIAEPVVKQNRRPLIDQYGASKTKTTELLKQRHIQQASYCQAMAQAGWRTFIVSATLSAPFVSGLGMAHPTETGLVLDHTSGVPYIPAASQKGVLRLAHIINTLLDEDGNWLSKEAVGRLDNVSWGDNGKLLWDEDAASKSLFGCGGEKNALAGQVVVLDAYPLAPPELGEEIMNPHFMKYYGKERGPTEDQSPVPIKFLVVKAGAKFVFRLLLRQPLTKAPAQDQESLVRLIAKAMERAISEEGMGAKTALGFGRFAITIKGEPESVLEWQRKHTEDKAKAARLAAETVVKEAAAAKEKKTLAVMNEAERLAYAITKGGTPESEIVEIYNKLTGFESADKKIIAAALKQCWLAADKWKVKPKQEKQWKKVQQVKAILGEV